MQNTTVAIEINPVAAIEKSKTGSFCEVSNFNKGAMVAIDAWTTTAGQSCPAKAIFMSVIFAALNRSDKISYQAAQQGASLQNNHYDFIIVGAGSAGAILANRLSEVPNWRILLLEAGRDLPQEARIPALTIAIRGTDLNWQYRSEPQRGFCNGTSCDIPRGRVLGGTSVLNGMLYVRGNSLDYDLWARQGNVGWSYNQVLPFFKKTERNNAPFTASNTRYHGTDGDLYVEWPPFLDETPVVLHRGMTELGLPANLDINAETQEGATILQTTTHAGERWDTYSAFLNPVKQRENLDIITRAQASKVLIDESTKRAYGVEFIDVNNRTHTAKASKEVIISGGTINSPQILMLSGVGPRRHLEDNGIRVIHDLPGVGRNFHDHPAGEGVYLRLNVTPEETDSLPLLMQDYTDYLSYPVRQGPLTSVGSLLSSAFIRTQYALDSRPDLELQLIPTYARDDPMDPQCNDAGDQVFTRYNQVTCLPVMMHPRSRGRILLRSSDPLEHPIIYQNLFNEEIDMQVVLEGMRTLYMLSQTEELRRHGITLLTDQIPECAHLEFATNEYWECGVRTRTWTLYHPAGTCKMGPSSDQLAVVDPELKVYGIDNLRVVDASIMPNVTTGNINAVVIMIGEKTAHHIKQHWLRESLTGFL